MRSIYLLAVWIHPLAAVVWNGGTAFLTLVLDRNRRLDAAWRGLGRRHQRRVLGWGSDFGRVLAAKLPLVAAILAASVTHDFVVGPRATRLLLTSWSRCAG